LKGSYKGFVVAEVSGKLTKFIIFRPVTGYFSGSNGKNGKKLASSEKIIYFCTAILPGLLYFPSIEGFLRETPPI
jgi:hypothetical protein